MKRKIIVTIMITILACAVFITGCKKNDRASTATTIPVATSENKYDLKGRVIKILDYVYTGKIEDLYTGEDLPYTAQLELKKLKAIQEKYNCTFEYVTIDDNLVQNIMDGKPPADFYPTSENYFYRIKDGNNIFIPLDKYKDILDLDNESIWDVSTQKALSLGKVTQAVYSLSQYDGQMQQVNVLYFNIAMLKKAGLWDKYNIYDMQANKTWNWDAFNKLCKSIKKDTNNDGKIDRYGLVFDFSTLNSLAVSNGDREHKASMVITNDKGEMKFAFNEPRQKAAFDMLNSLYKAGCVMAIDLSAERADKEGYNAFINGETLFYIRNINMTYSLKEDMKDEWGAVAMPIGPDNKSNEYRTARVGAFGTGILKGAENPEILCRILKEYSMPVVPVEEQVEAWVSGLKEWGLSSDVCDTIAMLSDTKRSPLDSEYTIGINGGTYNYFDYITDLFNKNITEKDFLQNKVPQVQSNIDDFWGKVNASLDALVAEEK